MDFNEARRIQDFDGESAGAHPSWKAHKEVGCSRERPGPEANISGSGAMFSRVIRDVEVSVAAVRLLVQTILTFG
jgi:hypothetical protein